MRSSEDATGWLCAEKRRRLNVGLILALSIKALESMAAGTNSYLIDWGANDSGQRTPPFAVTNAAALAGGAYHSLALLTDGSVLGWGDLYTAQTNFAPALN